MFVDENLQCRWIIENHIRLITVKNNLTVEALYANDTETVALMDGMSNPLHLVVDLRDLQTFPNLNEILNLRYLRHARMGLLLTVGAAHNRLTRFFLNAVGRITHVKYKDFDNVEGAIAFLEACDPSLKSNSIV